MGEGGQVREAAYHAGGVIAVARGVTAVVARGVTIGVTIVGGGAERERGRERGGPSDRGGHDRRGVTHTGRRTATDAALRVRQLALEVRHRVAEDICHYRLDRQAVEPGRHRALPIGREGTDVVGTNLVHGRVVLATVLLPEWRVQCVGRVELQTECRCRVATVGHAIRWTGPVTAAAAAHQSVGGRCLSKYGRR